nr:hypothetical protein [Tanacetum cinerariifolium]
SPVIHLPPQELSIQEMEDLKQQYLDELKHLSNLEYRDENKIAELTENFNGMSIEIQKKEKLLQLEQWVYLSTHPSKRLTSFCYDDDDDDEDYTSAITPNERVFSTEEPDNSLSMGDEHLDTILATESDEFLKSSVENLIPIPSDSKGILEHMCDVPFHDNSLPLDVSKIKLRISPSLTKNFLRLMMIPSLLTTSTMLRHHLSILSSSAHSSGSTTTPPDIFLLEYEVFHDDHVNEISSGSPTTHSDSSLYASFIFDLSINPFPPLDRNIRLIKKLLYDNSSPRPPKEFISANSDAAKESFSPSPILVKDSDSLMEEIDLFCTLDYPVPPGLEDKDYDTERDILIPKDLPSNNSLSFVEKSYFILIFLRFLVLLQNHQMEKSLDLLSHRYGTVKKFNTHRSHLNKCPMMIHGQNNPPLDVLLFHFYPP